MGITRKEFLKSSSILVGGLLLNKTKIFTILQDEKKGFKTIRNNLGIYTERGGTILWYVSPGGSAIIDSQFPDQAKNFMAGLKEKTDKKIDYLFNTHHHMDHTSGNIYLKDYVNHIAANENCARLQKEKNGQGDNAKNQAYPDITFKESETFVLGSEKVEAYHWYPAHTGGDSIYHFVNANVVHMGDLVFNRIYPYFGLSDEGSLKTWILYLDKAMDKFSNDTVFVFGHAYQDDKVIGTKDDLAFMKGYISALLDYTAKGKAAGKTRVELASATEIPGFSEIKDTRKGGLKSNIEQAFDELSR